MFLDTCFKILISLRKMLLLEAPTGSWKEETSAFPSLWCLHFSYSCLDAPYNDESTMPPLWRTLHFDGQIDKLEEELWIQLWSHGWN